MPVTFLKNLWTYIFLLLRLCIILELKSWIYFDLWTQDFLLLIVYRLYFNRATIVNDWINWSLVLGLSFLKDGVNPASNEYHD